MREVPAEIRKELDDVIKLLEDKKYHIDTLDKYPANPHICLFFNYFQLIYFGNFHLLF